MATEVKLPDLGEGIEDATINRWLIQEGDDDRGRRAPAGGGDGQGGHGDSGARGRYTVEDPVTAKATLSSSGDSAWPSSARRAKRCRRAGGGDAAAAAADARNRRRNLHRVRRPR